MHGTAAFRLLVAAIAALGTAAAGAQSSTLRVPGKPSATPKTSAPAALRLEHFPAGHATLLQLKPLAAAKSWAAGEGALEKRLAIGTARDIASAKAEGDAGRLRWVASRDGGWVARLTVVSPGAASLRLGLAADGLPPGAELRVSGSLRPQEVAGPLSGSQAMDDARKHGLFWTPVTAGEAQTLEAWLPPGADPAEAALAPQLASHLFAAPAERFKAAEVGSSQRCHEDIVCAARGNPALEKAARSVVKLLYTRNGTSYLCSGTLISDGDTASQVPYVLTAAHCVGSQAVAATLNTFWFFDAAACGAGTPGEYRQLSGGATLLHADEASDVALLRLSDRAPAGAWFSGWDASAVPPGTPFAALHHPMGDLKKLGIGRLMDPAVAGNTRYHTVTWLTGTTEPGSSGSGIFSEAGGEYLLRGGLKGGPASCEASGRDDPANRDYYSRLDQSAAALRQWLAAAAAPIEDYTDMWWNPDEPGWGVSIVQHPSNRIFVTWFGYGAQGEPLWLVMPDAAWRSAVALEGTLYRTTGSALEAAYDPARFTLQPAGTARIDFLSRDHAQVRFTTAAGTTVKPLQRQGF